MNDRYGRHGAAADRWAVSRLVALYLVSRIAASIIGVRFDLSPLATSWQILDPALLHHDLRASRLCMSGRSRLYTLLLGVVIKLSSALGGSWPWQDRDGAIRRTGVRRQSQIAAGRKTVRPG